MLTRRSLLLGGLRVTALIPTLPLVQGRSFRPGQPEQTPAGENVLVVVQLTGGNDGLNTIIPYAQDSYYRMRPTLGQAKSKMHDLDGHMAMHPSMRGMAELYQGGQVAILQGVGLPEANRSHFRSMDVWHTASLSEPLPKTGWLGRLADQLATATPGTLPALSIGSGELPYSLRAQKTRASSIRNLDSLRLDPRSKPTAEARDTLLLTPRNGDLDFLASTARASYATAHRLETLTSKMRSSYYPNTALAQGFAVIAQLVSAGIGCRLFHLQLDGFDTHARQATLHADRLNKLSSAITAFQRELNTRGIAKRVRTFVFSEFGRRAAENGSKGTDHGHGAPCFVIGEGVRGGLHGQRPELAKLVNGDVPATLDFRSVYSALEHDWMGAKTLWSGKRATL